MAKAMRLRWMRFAAIMIHGLFGRGRGKAPASEGGRYKKRVEFARRHGRIGRCGLRRKSGGKPSHSIGYWARKAASRETHSPPGLVRTSCCEPAAMVGVVNESVFISLNVTVADVPPKVAVVAD